MLRLAVLTLLLANAGYYAWSAGLLASWGLAPASDTEPQRLQQQIAPERIELLLGTGAPTAPMPTPASGGQTAATATPAPVCLQAGAFDARQAEALRQALADWPQGSWSLQEATTTARWMVYIGRMADEDAVAKKRAELRALKVAFDRPGQALEPGLSLGRFASEEAAQRSLKSLLTQGVKTARVVQERAEQAQFQLRLPAVGEALRGRLHALAPTLDERAFQPCD